MPLVVIPKKLMLCTESSRFAAATHAAAAAVGDPMEAPSAATNFHSAMGVLHAHGYEDFQTAFLVTWLHPFDYYFGSSIYISSLKFEISIGYLSIKK